jgi:hypothetical protein
VPIKFGNRKRFFLFYRAVSRLQPFSSSFVTSFLTSQSVVAIALPQHRLFAPHSFQKAIYILNRLTLFSFIAVLRGVYKTRIVFQFKISVKKIKKESKNKFQVSKKTSSSPTGFLKNLHLIR